MVEITQYMRLNYINMDRLIEMHNYTEKKRKKGDTNVANYQKKVSSFDSPVERFVW